jgi:hypothetical protein
MDENLFQLVTVGLLGVTLLVLLVTLLTLNKLTKKIEEGTPSGSRAPYEAEAPTGAPPGQVALAPTDEAATPEPAAATPDVATQASSSPATDTGQEHEPVVEQTEPEVASRAEDLTPVEQTGTSDQESQPAARTGFEDAPEEQPFERDGRWWFKRGDELLVYDEQSGQWEAAPPNATTTSPAPVVPGGDQTAASQAASQEAEPARAAEDPGSFWKCTSCGAVNGSTATSCRMCFAPKP